MLRNIIYIAGSVIIFFSGLVLYGIILHSSNKPLDQILNEKKIDSIREVQLVAHKRTFKLDLIINGEVIKTYPVVFGRNYSNIKTSKDDYVTPIGKYFICDIDTAYIYYKFLHINYPSEVDATEALKKNIISREEFLEITNALNSMECPPSNTALGSSIGIHGIGRFDFIFRNLPFAFNWTNGSIALSNENIDEIISVVDIGTPVIIKE